ncbi:protein ADP-ribosyltransferase PARP3 [Physcomitrium patens]|uniref:Poly [ADP-ribose] polymerase n=1 Tax=Physcomitrium patens TaxID=3218 RepID=A0A2K1L9A8_PHYPA|nr:poly [ADP-ribose] polymerase 3-like [Physcomitrium patens]PNR62594.1 hypothetical protein PHYPA_001018 [Physcomitrium patens]|eukprot:XP_024370917.1 poly [ADP-ribose] polymerase 3-like [Physcomitrella patens]
MTTATRETRGKARQDESYEPEPDGPVHEGKRQRVVVGSSPARGTRSGGKAAKSTKQDAHTEELNSSAEDTVEQFQEFVDKLKDECSIEDVRAIAVENGLNSLLPDNMLLHGVADQLFYGPLQTCPLCESHGTHAALICDGHQYKCSGFISEWTMCNYTAPSAERTNGCLKLPKKLKNEFLKQFEKSHDASKNPKRVLASGEKPFLGMTIVLSGRLSRKQGARRADIEKHGGKVANAIKPGVTCVIADARDASGGGGSTKSADAISLNIPVVREEWITDCIKQKEQLPLEKYDMAAEFPGERDVPWDKMSPQAEAALSLMAEVKLVGKRGVYKDTELEEEGGKIFENKDIIYNCAFSMCDMVAGINDYAIMQLIEMPNKAVYLYYKKGRVGDRLHNTERLEEMDSTRQAMREFVKLFETLTGNPFEPWEREKKFEKKPMKFFPVDMNSGVDARAGGLGVHQLGTAAAHTKMNSRVAQDLKVLMSQEVYRFAMTEMAIDAPDLPSGNLTEFHLERCTDVLQQFAAYLREPEEDELKHERMCLDFSNKWWSLVHTTRPFVIKDIDQVAQMAAPTLEALKAISVASQLIGNLKDESTLDDPLADRYAKLGCQITPLDHDSEDYKMISNYLAKTIAPVKFMDSEYSVNLQEACLIDSAATPSLKDIKKMSNKQLLWCGTRTCNLLACMKVGMPPASIEAPASGYMFGEGWYCSDSAARAAQFGFTAVDRPEGYLILAVVGLGDEILELTKPEEDVSQYKKKKVAIKGLGKMTTDPDGYIKFEEDITVPCGPLIPGKEDSPLDFNEFCVYDSMQVKPHYLLRVRYELVA